jgi:hypothetical protein
MSKKVCGFKNRRIFALSFAGVAKLVDASDLGSDAARHGGSSPSARTFKRKVMDFIK